MRAFIALLAFLAADIPAPKPPAKPEILRDARKVVQVSLAVQRVEKHGETNIVYVQPMLPITLEIQGVDGQGADGILSCIAFDKNLAKAGEVPVDITVLDCGTRGIFAISGIDFSKEE